ncbi:MAG: PrgI family protein [Acutalibacteraceae bacterium]|nr:PrgI family protein [Acutalibacteraceae bacterium]
MLEAKVHKEITAYKGKIVFGLTLKQLGLVVAALAVDAPLFIFTYKHIGVEIAGYLCMAVAIPFGLLCVDIKGMSFTKYFKLMYNYMFKNGKLTCINTVATDYLEKGVSEDVKSRNRNNRKTNPRYEYQSFYYRANTPKQLRAKRKEIRKYLATYKKEYVLQQKES